MYFIPLDFGTLYRAENLFSYLVAEFIRRPFSSVTSSPYERDQRVTPKSAFGLTRVSGSLRGRLGSFSGQSRQLRRTFGVASFFQRFDRLFAPGRQTVVARLFRHSPLLGVTDEISLFLQGNPLPASRRVVYTKVSSLCRCLLCVFSYPRNTIAVRRVCFLRSGEIRFPLGEKKKSPVWTTLVNKYHFHGGRERREPRNEQDGSRKPFMCWTKAIRLLSYIFGNRYLSIAAYFLFIRSTSSK